MAVNENTTDCASDTPFRVEPATPTIGAFITGLDLGND